MGTFYGIGLGPGDPELITVKALNILKQVGQIFAPASRDGRSLAGEIIKHHLPGAKIEYLEFPMTEDPEQLRIAWDKATIRVGSRLAGQTAAFVTLGDPFLYGTYLYLYRGIKDRYPEVEIITVPGIPGMCATAARSNFYLAADNERLLLITGKVDPGQFEEYCQSFETIVIYKPRINLAELLRHYYQLCPAGTGVIVERCGMAGEKITYLGRETTPMEVNYFTIVILHPKESRCNPSTL